LLSCPDYTTETVLKQKCGTEALKLRYRISNF
jgi:hypothetical protein